MMAGGPETRKDEISENPKTTVMSNPYLDSNILIICFARCSLISRWRGTGWEIFVD